MQPKFIGTITDGQFVPERAAQYKEHLAAFEGKRVESIIQRIQRPKTNPQNRYFHGVVVPFVAKLAGYNPEYKRDLQIVRDSLKSDYGPKINVPSFVDMPPWTSLARSSRGIPRGQGQATPLPPLLPDWAREIKYAVPKGNQAYREPFAE